MYFSYLKRLFSAGVDICMQENYTAKQFDYVMISKRTCVDLINGRIRIHIWIK